MKVSVQTISKETGFSPATVSNALNRKKGVNKKTAEIIWKKAEELGYRVENRLTKIKFVIFRRNGLIIDNNQFHPAVIEGVEKQAKDMGYETVFSYLDIHDADYEERVAEITEDTSGAVVLLGTEMNEADFQVFSRAKCKIILLDGWSDRYFFNSVLISNTDSACRAVEYLINRGHREIGYIAGDYRIQAFRYREIGYLRAMERAGIPARKGYLATVGTKIETAYEGMKRYLEKDPELPTAFFADNDVIAIGAMRAMKEKGVRIPEDVSVIGFDNIPYGMICNPPLTTIHVYKQEMGAVAVRELLETVQNPSRVNLKIQLCTEFVERGSVRSLRND